MVANLVEKKKLRKQILPKRKKIQKEKQHFCQVSRLTQLTVWTDEYHGDAKEEKIKQLGTERGEEEQSRQESNWHLLLLLEPSP